MNPTTRRYPRTLLEAFPCDASNANPIQRYRQPLPKRLFFGSYAMAGVLYLCTSLFFSCLAVLMILWPFRTWPAV